MLSPQSQSATYQQLVELPEHWVGEIIDDSLISHPRPAPRHALASSYRRYGRTKFSATRGK
ncbi:hypothetical protein D5085_03885 [Ectothiorhodospiraceae bacterium BW-2]|nr:hypothetical protein D5085_03885 [Ectothiorhodospiraceae bacterium BW-2]